MRAYTKVSLDRQIGGTHTVIPECMKISTCTSLHTHNGDLATTADVRVYAYLLSLYQESF
jgi:hypothetical protein